MSASRQPGAPRSALGRALSGGPLRRSIAVMLVVGSVLNLINQGDALWGNAALDVPKLVLTYLVPFFVATYGAWSALSEIEPR